MKTRFSSNNNGRSRRPPPIPFNIFNTNKEYNKDNSLTFKLRSNLTDSASMNYELTVPIFNTGPVYQLIHFQEELNKVFVGQNVTTGPGKFAMTRRLLRGEALQAYNAGTATPGFTETNASHEACMQRLFVQIFPNKLCAPRRGT